MRSMLWKRLIPVVGLLVLAFALPAGAEGSPLAGTGASQRSVPALGTCQYFHLGNWYGSSVWAYNDGGDLGWKYVSASWYGDEFCQAVLSGSNVIIYDTATSTDCLAYNSTNGRVYLHANCGTASYEQWKFIPVGSSGSQLYNIENGYQVNGVNYCLQDTTPATEGQCSPENHPAVLYYSPVP